jgi:hypothetical protein
MSESYAVVPITNELRPWLETIGCASPKADGSAVSLAQLKRIVSSVQDVTCNWGSGQFQDGHLKSSEGWQTTIIVGKPGSENEPCEFHFRGGEPELVERVVRELAHHAGPQLIHAHSGGYTRVIEAPHRDT